MMKHFLILIFLIIAANVKAQSVAPSDEELTETFTEEDIKELDAIKSGTVLKKRDAKTGFFLRDYNTENDGNRFSLLGHINKDFETIGDVMAGEVIYAKRFDLAWIEVFGLMTKATLGEIAKNNPSTGSNTLDFRNSADTVRAFGAGVSYRNRWIQSIFNSDKVFSTTAASLGWYMLNNNERSEDYAGPGMKADFGIHRRGSRTTHYGFKMSYHLAHVKKEKEFDTESSTARSLLLTWLTFGFDLSFYW